MFRLLMLLSVTLFLTLLIGGRDNGQMRAGLMQQPERQRPVMPVAQAEPATPMPTAPVQAAPVTLASAETVPVPLISMAAATEPALREPEAVIVPAVATGEPAASVDEPAAALRWVSAQAINVRQGPSTGNPVIGRLTRGEAVSVVEDTGDGWVMIRIEGDGVEGYVAARLLTDADPNG